MRHTNYPYYFTQQRSFADAPKKLEKFMQQSLSFYDRASTCTVFYHAKVNSRLCVKFCDFIAAN